MFKNILIIGAGRVGKTTLAKMINQKYGYSVVSIDDIVTALDAFPELGLSWKSDNLEKAKKLSGFLAKYLKELSEGNKFYGGCKTVIEGAAVDLDTLLPQINQRKYLLIGLTNNETTKEELFENLRRHDTEDDWTYYLSDKELAEFCAESVELNRRFAEKFKELNLLTFDTSKNRQEVLNEIVGALEEKCKYE